MVDRPPFFDYALLAAKLRRAMVAELEQVSGARQRFSVVTMPSGSRKQLMYDLTSRIVDAHQHGDRRRLDEMMNHTTGSLQEETGYGRIRTSCRTASPGGGSSR